ncbi:DUF6163 family protein [Microbaculum marinum]|uniref:DUF6163 family protein n=1 Tax=Microbaculum marinum TaxID=1764581 RepID=A0AAW9RTX3_9HYPH
MPLQFAKSAPLAPTILLWYLRSLAVFYFAAGLLHWSRIIGVLGPGFETMPVHMQIATVYFALLQVVASVGLWCGAAWGVAAWLFCAVAELVMHLGFSDLFGSAWLTVLFHFVTIFVYVGLAWWTGTPENTGEILRLPEE